VLFPDPAGPAMTSSTGGGGMRVELEAGADIRDAAQYVKATIERITP
jgi:hypothetical protein